MLGSMKRREFIHTVGIAGVISLLGASRLEGSSPSSERSASEGLGGPFAGVFDPRGDLIVTDPSRYRLVRLDSARRQVSTFGEPGAEQGRLNFPLGVALGPDNLIYVVDSNNCRVQTFDTDGRVKGVLGSIGSTAGSFAHPQGICFDAAGRLLVADTRNHRVQIFQGNDLVAVIGELGDEKDQFRLPTAVLAGPGGEVLVLDSKHGLVKVFGADLGFSRGFGGVGNGPGMLNMPQGMALDGSRRLWVADTGNHRIQAFSLDGKVVSVIGKRGSAAGEFDSPTGVVTRGDELCVLDNGNGRVQFLNVG